MRPPLVRRRATPWPQAFDAALRLSFASPEGPADAPYAHAFRYLVTSFYLRRTPGGAGARQPGARSEHGRKVDDMEGFSRLAPLLAAWVAGGRPRRIDDLSGRPVDVLELLRDGLLAGTDPAGRSYWGLIGDFDQRTVEAADIARALWACRDHLTPELTDAQRAQIGAWLLQVNGKAVYDNNWHLFPVVVNEALHALGLPSDLDQAAGHFSHFMSFYRGEGWFGDGRRGRIDWYNAWAIHYELFWLREISGRYRTPELDEIVQQFAETMPYLISPNGIPIMGRSICYRLAGPTPLVAAAVASIPIAAVAPGLARHALDCVWRYFVARGAFSDGRITQGYFGTDLRLLDNYSGPSSPLWGTRPLVLAFLAPQDAAFWTAPSGPLPVEVAAFSRPIASIGWHLQGDPATGDVRILRNGATPDTPPVANALRPYTLPARLAGLIGRSPRRPPNLPAKYELAVYSALTPFLMKHT